MMNVTVSVNLLEGLVMESKGRFVEHTRNHITSSNSLPVTAVVSFLKNVSSCQTIATHVPSLPIGAPSSSEGKKEHNFMARWPVDFDPDGDALSTLKISRLMRKELVPIDHQNNELKLGFVAEEIELIISLMQGSEMLTLGKANLVITGEETQEMVIDLPVQMTKRNHDKENKEKIRRRSPSPFRRSASPFRRNSTKQVPKSTKVLKPVSFSGDSKRRYKLSEHAIIRVQVQVFPHYETAQYDDLEFEPNENLYNKQNTRNTHQFERQRTNQSISSTISKFNAIDMEDNISRKRSSSSKVKSNYGKFIHKPVDYYGDAPAPAPVPVHTITTVRSKQSPRTTKTWSPEPVLNTLSNSLGSGYHHPVPKVVTPRTKYRADRLTAQKYSNRAQSKEAYRKKLQTYSGYPTRNKDDYDGKRTLVSRPPGQQVPLQQVPSPSEKVANWLFSWGGEEEPSGRERSTRQKNLHEKYETYDRKKHQTKDDSFMCMEDSDEDDNDSSSSDSTEGSDEDTTYNRFPTQTEERRGRSPRRRASYGH
jgi:hypothetical protein